MITLKQQHGRSLFFVICSYIIVVQTFSYSSRSAFGAVATKKCFRSEAASRNGISGAQYLTARCSRSDAIVEAGVGDLGCQLKSPSGINMLPLPIQALTFFGYFAALAIGTYFASSLLDQAKSSFPLVESSISTSSSLGLVYLLAGIAHFKLEDDFSNIMPAQGAWGLWYLPGSKQFHVYWTGVAEIVLGALLIVGYAASLLGYSSDLTNDLIPISSLGLLILTLLVTPSNIYMLTHGAKLPKTDAQEVSCLSVVSSLKLKDKRDMK